MSGESQFASTRDLRLDFTRGFAIYMVLVDHVIGDPVSHFTYRVLGYSDAAEIFVFVSGLTCGIVYFRLFSKTGWPSLLSALAKRACRIYFYYALSSLAIVLLVTISRAEFGPNMSALAGDPVYTSWSVLSMVYSPEVSGILLLYLPLTLVVLPLFFWGARHNTVATLCISGSVWLIAQLFPQFGDVLTERTLLNPLAWQFLFVIGLFVGTRNYASAEQRLFKRAGWFVAAAWMVVGFSFLYRFSLFISPRIGFDLEWLRIPMPTLMHMKETLSPLRLLHFLSAALLFATYIRPNSSIIQSFVAKSFAIAGRRSLEMYSASAVLSMVTNVFVLAYRPSMAVHLILDCVIASTIALTAIMITRSDRRHSELIGK